MRLGVESSRNILKENIEALLKKGTYTKLAEALKYALENWDAADPEAKANSTKIKSLLPKVLENPDTQEIVQKIIELQSYFIQKSIWCIGGDGWAYNIGYGGLDHVFA